MTQWLKNNRSFLIILLVFGLFRTALADWNPIPSESMHPTLLDGDVVLVNRIAYDLKVPLTDISLARLGEPRREAAGADLIEHCQRRQVERHLQCPAHRHRALESEIEILRLIAAITCRPVIDERLRMDEAVFKTKPIDERLER